MNTKTDPKTAPLSKALLKYRIEITKDVNFRKFNTRFSVNELDTAVIRFTPDIQTYLSIEFSE